MSAKKPSPFAKKVKPKRVDLSQRELVTFKPFSSDNALPLLVEPAVPDLDIKAWAASVRDDLVAKLYAHGALLFRGFRIPDTDAFEGFAAAVCPDLFTEYGDLPKAGGKVYGVTPYPPDKTILFHNESSHLHQWPMKQFFYCHTPAASGGETPIVDCRLLMEKIDPDLVDRIQRHGLLYIRNFIEGVDVSWQDFFKTDDPKAVNAFCERNGIEYQWRDGNLSTRCKSPGVVEHPITGQTVFFNQIQLHHIAFLEDSQRETLLRMFDIGNMPRNVHLGNGDPLSDEEVRLMEQVCWEHATGFPWRHGDVLMVDNMLVSHARNPYTLPRAMYVAMGDIFQAESLNHTSQDEVSV